jgi:hypothetical protein
LEELWRRDGMNVEMGFERPPRIDLPFGIGHSWITKPGFAADSVA